MAEKAREEEVGMAPDPDEDDLDDLDDVLDEFSANPAPGPAAPARGQPAGPTRTTAPTASGPGRPTKAATSSAEEEGAEEEDFATQLQAGMSSLISELDGNPDMQAQFERMMQELIAAGAAETDAEAGHHVRKAAEAEKGVEALEQTGGEKRSAAGPGVGPKTASSGGATAGDDRFGETIRRTMERMQHSDSTAAASASTSGAAMSEEEMLAQMMRELQAGGGGAGGDGDEDFNALLLNMMSQLTNKEILYEPMKELHTKFPEWMGKNEGKVGKAEMERYREQQKLVGEIVGRFERTEYSDEDEGDREFIVERMQKMQAAGSPPTDLVGDMNAAQEALGGLDAGCPTQ